MTRTRPPRLCSCGKIIPHGERCACQRANDRARNARHDTRRENASRRGYDREWRDAARDFLRLPGNDRCECGAPATLVRHVVSIRRHPELRMHRANWRPGCRRCNALDYIRERRR
ncbi:MAG: endonuclease [Mesorhizobium sp.]|nr:endonuclease [Mesorhizobium sp.]